MKNDLKYITCTSKKKRFAFRPDAVNYARGKHFKGMKPRRVYRCPYCKFFHITTNQPTSNHAKRVARRQETDHDLVYFCYGDKAEEYVNKYYQQYKETGASVRLVSKRNYFEIRIV